MNKKSWLSNAHNLITNLEINSLEKICDYSGRLDGTELCELVERMNNRINSQVNQGTGRITLLYLKKEKAFLNPLPTEEIRKHYRIATHRCRVNPSSMVTYKIHSILCHQNTLEIR